MATYPTIDLETLKWVKSEVDVTLQRAEEQVQQYIRSDDKAGLINLVNHLHQVVGSLQMLELKSLSTLLLECEALVEDYGQRNSSIRKASFVVLIDSALSMLKSNLERIQRGDNERPIEIVELVNQIRTVRGLDDIEISSVFSPMIDIYPQINSEKSLSDRVYAKRAGILRSHYQMALLDFLKEEQARGAAKMSVVFDKVLEMSTFTSVARLWWVAGAYADFLSANKLNNKSVHTRILRQIDDLLRELSSVGESALVSDPGAEIIKIMLFYTAAADEKTQRMEHIIDAFHLQDYFGEQAGDISQEAISESIAGLIESGPNLKGVVSSTRELVTDYFESDAPSEDHLKALIKQLELLASKASAPGIEFIPSIAAQAKQLVAGILAGNIPADDETGFHLASAIIHIDNALSFPNEFDADSYQTAGVKLAALEALVRSEPVAEDPSEGKLSNRDRKELLAVLSSEIEGNLTDVESSLEAFALDLSDTQQIEGLAEKVKQVRGALQVLGEQKVSLLLSITESEFKALERRDKHATVELVEALAISIGTMEEYVRGLKSGRVGMDYILDRSITDLEVAIGKKVMRSDVEDLLERASSSLFSWLGDQSNFDLFTELKSSLRDLTVLARKTKLNSVEHLIKEQDRLVDVISQEPAFLNDNIIGNLQNNMAAITGQIIQLYGTEESIEELAAEADLRTRKSRISKDVEGVRIFDEMDVSEMGEEISLQDIEERSSTIIAREHAEKSGNQPRVNDAIFQAFIEEAEELIAESDQYYRACEDDLQDRDATRNLRRVFHTLKGSSRMVGLNNIGEVAWLCESIFNYVLDTGKPLTYSALSFAKRALEEIERHRKTGFRSGEKINITSWGDEAKQLSGAIDKGEDARDQKNADPVMTYKADSKPSDSTSPDSKSPDSKSPESKLSDSENAAEEKSLNEVSQNRSESDSDNAAQDDSVSSSISTSGSTSEETSHEDDDGLIEFESSDLSANDDVEGELGDAAEGSQPAEGSSLAESEDHSEDADDVIEFASVTDDNEVNSGLDDEDDDDVLVLDLESSVSVDINDVLDVSGSSYNDEDSVLELDLSLVDADEEIDLSSVGGFKLDSPNEDLDEESSSYLSFQVIDDDAMREVFIEEANETLQTLRREVAQTGLEFKPEDSLSIGLHTLLGNLNTLGLEDPARAYQAAENYCTKRLEQQAKIDDSDQSLFGGLIALTQEMLDSSSQEAPFFNVNPEWWVMQAGLFVAAGGINQATADEDSESHTSDEQAKEEGDQVVDLAALNLELDLLNDEQDQEVEELNELLDPNAQDIEIIDAESYLAQIDEADKTETRATLEDDLENIEASISQHRVRKPFIDDESMSDDDDSYFLDDDDDQTIETKPKRESLIPPDLTDLLADPDVDEHDSTPSSDSEINDEASADQDSDQEHVQELENEPSGEADDSDTDETGVDEVIREIFIGEMRDLQNELDNDVAGLNELSASAPFMANIMRHLHTIKGSALVAEAISLGRLTHQLESYLEATHIRDGEDLKQIQTTLEYFVDDLDRATSDYAEGNRFSPSDYLRDALELEDDLNSEEESASSVLPDTDGIDDNESEDEQEKVSEPKEDVQLSIEDFTEGLNTIDAALESISSQWKSVRGWWKIRPQYLQLLTRLRMLARQYEPARNAQSLVLDVEAVLKVLQFRQAGEFDEQSGLVLKTLDATLKFMRSQAADSDTDEDADKLSRDLVARIEQLRQFADTNTNAGAPVKPATDKPTTNTKATVAAQRSIESALKIKAETLDSLTNFVGDASMSRSQMREDVSSLKGVVADLFRNVERFGSQLRELEIEADTRISARNKEKALEEKDTEFDPLELDRYTKLQELSRGLTENLDGLGEIQNALTDFVHKTESSLQRQDRLNRDLQDEIMQVRLVSFGGIAPQLRQLVRRTARELGKEVDLEIVGSEVRLDKTILDGVTPALEHMLRNAVDHGIESPKERKSKGKPETGTITVSCRQVSREIILSVRDDGAGLDLEKIRLKAVENNLLEEDQELKAEDMMVYISQSGFSTADRLTEISGRGVGMDVVQASLRRMSGSVQYDLDNDKSGSNFIINLPISLAVSSAMFVRAANAQFAVPARVIERMVKLDAQEIRTKLAENAGLTELDGKRYKLIDLADYLGFDSTLESAKGKQSVILVDAGVQNIAVVVDELLDTQEIVVKNLGEHLGRIPIYSGATIRPNGDVVLVLDLVGISFYESTVALPARSRRGVRALPLVMVVDDSLTIRKAAQRDLTALGIDSVLAKNGVDAQQQIKTNKPDLILLDIEMPEMDGFEFLRWLREESGYNELPVAMISSRSTEKYMDKALELGCDAFLGKPYLLDDLIDLFNEYLPLESPILKGQGD